MLVAPVDTSDVLLPAFCALGCVDWIVGPALLSLILSRLNAYLGSIYYSSLCDVGPL